MSILYSHKIAEYSRNFEEAIKIRACHWEIDRQRLGPQCQVMSPGVQQGSTGRPAFKLEDPWEGDNPKACVQDIEVFAPVEWSPKHGSIFSLRKLSEHESEWVGIKGPSHREELQPLHRKMWTGKRKQSWIRVIINPGWLVVVFPRNNSNWLLKWSPRK